MKNKVHWLNAGHYPVYVGVCFEEKAFHRELKKLGVADKAAFTKGEDYACTHMLESDTGKVMAIMTFNHADATGELMAQIAGLVAHECVHVKQFIQEHIGEDKFGDETEAYLVQNLVQQVLVLWERIYKPRFKKP